jgi:hypothetical protein
MSNDTKLFSYKITSGATLYYGNIICVKEPVTSKICLNNKMIKRTTAFTYLG